MLASVGVSVVLITGVSAWRNASRDAALEVDRLQAEAAVLSSLTSEAAASGDRAEAYQAIRSIELMPGVAYARVEAANGALLSETGSGVRLVTDATAAKDARAPSLFAILRSRTIEVSAPIVYARQTVGRVVLDGKLAGGERLASSLWISLIAALVAALAGLIVAWRMGRRIAAPMTALTGVMAEIEASHDYTRPVVLAADGEVGLLVEGFNRMLGEIRGRDEGLERTVANRTRELREAKDVAEDANRAKSDFLAVMSRRDPHPDERGDGDGRASGRRRSCAAPAPLRRGDRQVGRQPDRHHQRHPRLLEDRGRPHDSGGGADRPG